MFPAMMKLDWEKPNFRIWDTIRCLNYARKALIDSILNQYKKEENKKFSHKFSLILQYNKTANV